MTTRRYYVNNQVLELTQEQFSDLFWQEKVELRKKYPNATFVIAGQHYMVLADQSSGLRGYGGRKFIIKTFDFRVITTHNLWHQGTVPERFRKELPDNATFDRIESTPYIKL